MFCLWKRRDAVSNRRLIDASIDAQRRGFPPRRQSALVHFPFEFQMMFFLFFIFLFLRQSINEWRINPSKPESIRRQTRPKNPKIIFERIGSVDILTTGLFRMSFGLKRSLIQGLVLRPWIKPSVDLSSTDVDDAISTVKVAVLVSLLFTMG